MFGMGVDLIDVYAGGALDARTASFLTNTSNELRSTLSGDSLEFFNNASSMYSIISTKDSEQILRNLNAKKDSLWVDNTIRSIMTLEGMQTAGPIMQRWIMANPEIRGRYLNQELEGYMDTYQNLQGDTIGEAQYDYRRVMNGVVQVEDDRVRSVNWHEPLAHDDDRLSMHQVVDIINTWNKANYLVSLGEEDPTSANGAHM